MQLRTKIEGLEPLKAQLLKQPQVVGDYTLEALQQTTYAVWQRMRATVPRDSGALRESLTIRNPRGYSTAGRATTGVFIQPGTINGRNPETYWRFVEFGSIHNPAFRPFIRPSTDAEGPQLEARLRSIAMRIERDFSTGRFL